MTVGELKNWLALKSVDLPINVMIETDDCQYEFPLNDMAEVKSLSGAQRIILMHEKAEVPTRTEK